ncbi:Polyribonucleotide nucleotidyltransferase [Trema orientale]|uniref:Polyribonucleotide nucleotidyltransferase n=1 Tax=Trema orientale TaxID=63057 RepID=A0A2P5FGZ4_TREOI|nr:Polyribonucleotide nucleotidyltransferase [Trema orientale]
MSDYSNSSLRPSSPVESDLHSNHHYHHYHVRRGGACNRKESEGRRPRGASWSRPRPRRRSPLGFKVLPGQVAFRLFCHQAAIGGVIGNCGAVVSQLRRETDTKIHCENPAPGSDHGVVLVIGSGSRERRIVLNESEGEECEVSSAQEAVLRVLERIWKLEAQSEGAAAASGVVWCRLLGERSQIGALMGKGGTNIIRMRKESSADIRIVPARQSAPNGFDEVIQIAGSILAVKKAFIAVSSCLQDQSFLESEPTFFNRSTERSSSGESHDSEPNAEFFPNLSSLLPRPSFDKNASVHPSMADANGVSSTDDAKGTRQEVVFRLLCTNDTAGSVIGRKGSIVRALENETGADIRFAAPKTSSGERVVTISAFEDLESWYSPAQNAVILVFARTVEGDIEKGFLLGFSNGATVTAKLLVATDLVSCLSENEGKVISDIKDVSGADVRILGGTLENQVVQITGEYRQVQNALFQVTSTLRSSFRRVIEPTSSRPEQSLFPSPDHDAEALLTSLMNRVVLSHSQGAFEPKSQLPQTIETGNAKSVTDAGETFTKFGVDFEVASRNKLAVVTNTILEIVVSRQAFSSIYGEDGGNLNRLKEISGAKVEVHDPRPGESEGKVVISGTPDQTLAAQSLLQAFIQTSKKS